MGEESSTDNTFKLLSQENMLISHGTLPRRLSEDCDTDLFEDLCIIEIPREEIPREAAIESTTKDAETLPYTPPQWSSSSAVENTPDKENCSPQRKERKGMFSGLCGGKRTGEERDEKSEEREDLESESDDDNNNDTYGTPYSHASYSNASPLFPSSVEKSTISRADEARLKTVLGMTLQEHHTHLHQLLMARAPQDHEERPKTIVWTESPLVDSDGRNAFMALQHQGRFESTVSKNETLLRRSLAAPDLLLMTAAPQQKKTSLKSMMCALGLPRSRTKHLLFPKIRSGDLDLDAEPFARGSSKNVFRARLRKTVPSVGPSGHLVAVLQVWKKKNTLDTELEVFAKIGNHPFLTRLVAVMSSDSQDGTVFVTEFAELGSLDKVLTNLTEKKEKASPEVLLRAALQVLEGMVWLQKKKILHRDLALRSLLVFSFDAQDPDKVLVKITDYGLACFDNNAAMPTISSSSPTSPSSNEDGMMRQIRWMSPEAILWRTWTEKSEVWAFGVVLWELFTHGNLPYSSLYTQCDLEVGKLVVAGHRLSRPMSPAECPLGIFVVMQKCWQEQVEKRPTVTEIKTMVHREYLFVLI